MLWQLLEPLCICHGSLSDISCIMLECICVVLSIFFTWYLKCLVVVYCRYRFQVSGVHYKSSELENYCHENRFV